MSKIVDDLRKGNHTLELKVRTLEQENERLREELSKIKTENYTLKNKIYNFESQKRSSEDLLLNHFGGIFKQMSDLVVKNMD